jgi:4-diphosphocytidyl-2-C-methyl-D-erythritol kinase
MSGLTVEAPAKINLHLRVGEKQASGRHKLESLFVPLAFGDTLGVELLEGGGPPSIQTEGLPEPIPPEENILFRTAVLFGEKTGFRRRLGLKLVKRIPLGGGLGGGSSDAAALLGALNRLSGAALSRKRLMETAAELGSDVPFFLYGGPAWVSGTGESLEAADFPGGLAVVLVNPGFRSDTAEAYRRLDGYRLKRGIPPVEARPGENRRGTAVKDPRLWPYKNDFLEVFQEEPREDGDGKAYGAILAALRKAGADFSGLSGSGSTCFGIFMNGGKAKKTKRELSKTWNFVQMTFSLARLPEGVVKSRRIFKNFIF